MKTDRRRNMPPEPEPRQPQVFQEGVNDAGQSDNYRASGSLVDGCGKPHI